MSYPKVFVNTRFQVAPVVVRNAIQEAALDLAEWSPAPLAAEQGNAGFPKLMFNINLPPKMVFDPGQERALGGAWRPSPVVIPDVPAVEISPASDSMPLAGGTGSFTVTISGIGKSQSWTATKDDFADWLTFTPTGAQTADGPVNYTVAANASGDARTAHIYVNGKTFTIDQAGGIA